MRALAAALVLLMLTVAGCSDSDTGSSVARPDLQRTLEYVTSEGTPGVVAAVRDRSGTWHGAAGLAVLHPRRAMQKADRFRIASVTKPFVAAVVLQLVDERRLALNETVERRLPGLLPQGSRITIRQLLNHTSGLFNFTDDERFRARLGRNLRLVVPPRQEIAIAASRPPVFPPGSDWAYSNTGYQVLGLIVERVTGRELGKVLEQRIFGPLALRHTSFEPGPSLKEPIAHGYALPGGEIPTPGGRPRDVTQSAGGGAWAAGAIVSNTDDLARFFGALLGGKVVSRERLRQMMTTVSVNSGLQYGLGLYRTHVTCGYAWGHDGGIHGFLTQVLAGRDGSRVVVMAANGDSDAVGRALSASAQTAYCTS
jgi:D-alanyl-D-alanine carboxypeptidase